MEELGLNMIKIHCMCILNFQRINKNIFKTILPFQRKHWQPSAICLRPVYSVLSSFAPQCGHPITAWHSIQEKLTKRISLHTDEADYFLQLVTFWTLSPALVTKGQLPTNTDLSHSFTVKDGCLPPIKLLYQWNTLTGQLSLLV